MLLLALTAGLVLILASKLYKFLGPYSRLVQLSKQFAVPPTNLLLGNAHLLLGIPAHEVVPKMLATIGECGKIMGFWFGPFIFSLFMLDTKSAESVLSSQKLLTKSLEYGVFDNWLREGLLILEEFIEVFDRNARIFVRNLQTINNNEGLVADMGHWINLATLDVICETAMGVSVHAQTNVDSEYVKAVKTISTVLHKRMFDILYRFNLTYQFTKLARDEKKALAVLHGFTEKIIVQRRAELLKAAPGNAPAQATDDGVGTKRRMAFLDILLQSEVDGKPLTNLDIREEVDTFMFEGHDTTSSAITFCFYNLAMYPECQQKCFEEILQVFGRDKTKPVTYEDLNNLHYVELCIKETLRLFPSVPLLGRKVTEECEINGKIVPAGTNIGISPLYLGRQEELFPDAQTFKPERFQMDYANNKMSPYAYIPFSAGPRNCIGQRFAMLEVKTVLTNVLRHYELDYAGNKEEELLLIAELILRPKDPLMFKIKPRVY